MGFDDYVNMVLEDVTELYVPPSCHYATRPSPYLYSLSSSDYSGNHTKMSKILLNGNNICMVCSPPGEELYHSVNSTDMLFCTADPRRRGSSTGMTGRKQSYLKHDRNAQFATGLQACVRAQEGINAGSSGLRPCPGESAVPALNQVDTRKVP